MFKINCEKGCQTPEQIPSTMESIYKSNWQFRFTYASISISTLLVLFFIQMLYAMFKLFRIKNYILVGFSVNFAYNISEQGNLLRLSALLLWMQTFNLSTSLLWMWTFNLSASQLEMRIVIFREINFYLPVLL